MDLECFHTTPRVLERIAPAGLRESTVARMPFASPLHEQASAVRRRCINFLTESNERSTDVGDIADDRDLAEFDREGKTDAGLLKAALPRVVPRSMTSCLDDPVARWGVRNWNFV